MHDLTTAKLLWTDFLVRLENLEYDIDSWGYLKFYEFLAFLSTSIINSNAPLEEG